MRRIIFISVLIAAGAFLLLGGLGRESRTGAAPVAAAQPPLDGDGLVRLAEEYQQRARDTGDPSFYSRSEEALTRALAFDRNDLGATIGLGALALSRHEFREALAIGRRAKRLSPGTARSYGVTGDALAELGRYDAAFREFDRMAELRPDLASYARVSHAQDLLGRTGPAVRTLRLALQSARGRGEPEAWTHTQLGRLRFGRGQVRQAAADYRAALRVSPGYPAALHGLALAEWARGRTQRAIELEQAAVERAPLPEYVAQLGDLHAAAGDRAGAREQHELVGAIERLQSTNGVRTDLETALFRADHRIAPERTVALARRARRARPSIDGDDVLAWSLVRAGRCEEALPFARRSLRLGTRDALKWFHRGMAERCAGNAAAGREWLSRALELNPRFSVRWAPVAERIARA